MTDHSDRVNIVTDESHDHDKALHRGSSIDTLHLGMSYEQFDFCMTCHMNENILKDIKREKELKRRQFVHARNTAAISHRTIKSAITDDEGKIAAPARA